MSFLRWAVVTVPLVLLLGFASGRAVVAGGDNAWYAALVKPAQTPPDWLFPVAWTTLYILLGLAVAIVLNARGARGRAAAILAFVVSFGLSLGWTPLFFGAHRIDAAFWLIVAMLASGIVATVLFARVRTVAAWLVVPYLVWISFAGVLTWRIGQLNPDGVGVASPPHTSQML
ncbi:TspO/MBR family protein [Sphingomonas sp. KR1UV-12]|uniref:TspO/MBR family protein n=2 Tax=Sphingomonas aurea TaxID=3063994 RepID=A0ABT9EN75_9SPHN|nr:TspO/MBR family protein [Sphingomonas sp. KR1UV-12]